MKELISDADLKLSDIPAPLTEWHALCDFCLSIDGYTTFTEEKQQKLMYRKCIPATLTELRTALFLEQRKFRGWDTYPEENDLTYLQALVEAIRAHIVLRDCLHSVALTSAATRKHDDE
jgi:hypothetical protein